jgi:hypothetical protein
MSWRSSATSRMVACTTCSLVALLGACGGAENPSDPAPSPDVVADAQEDTAPEVTPDVPAEVTPDQVDPPEVTPEDIAEVDAGPTGWVQAVEDGQWHWLSHHDGLVQGAHQYQGEPDAYYEYTRFEVFQPFELRTIRMVPNVQEDATFRAYVWDDLGGNFLHLDPAGVLASFEQEITAADGGTWLEFTLDPPIRVEPGRIFYVGTIVNGATGARLAIDAEPSEVEGDKASASLVWLSKELDPTTQTHTVFSAGAGDYLVDVEVRHVDAVLDDDFVFQEVDATVLGFTGAGSYFDLEGDGDLDGANGTQIWRNDGTGHYTDVTGELMAGMPSGRGHWADFDNDGDQDVFLSGLDEHLLRNDGDTFTNITETAGIDDSQTHTCNGVTSDGHVPTETATWIDYDSDGLLDLYLGNFICWEDGFAAKDMLFRNNGDGTFSDVSDEAGIYLWQGYGQAARSTSPADYDNDGDMDLLVNNYRLHRNIFWRNNGDGTLSDVGAATTLAGEQATNGAYGHAISSAWGDYDHDGYLDVFIANLAHPRFLAFSDKQSLYMSSGGADPVFANVTDEVGIRYQETPSGAVSWDYDNDGDLDLTWTCVYAHRPSQFYRNDWPDGGWTEVTYPTGLRVDGAWVAATADLDDDGDLDYASNKLFLNRNPWERNAIQIRPLGRGLGGTNRDGFGARVRVMVDGTERMQEKVPSSGISNQSSPWLHFGIGKAEAADVTVDFPVSGESYDFISLGAGRYTVDEDGNLTVER